jgi:hypothetical protein
LTAVEAATQLMALKSWFKNRLIAISELLCAPNERWTLLTVFSAAAALRAIALFIRVQIQNKSTKNSILFFIFRPTGFFSGGPNHMFHALCKDPII